MKHSYLPALSFLALCLTSCFEIEDLEQTYQKQYKPTEFTEIECATHYSDQITFMRIRFNILNYKKDSKLMAHYTDVEGADPFQSGNSIDLTSYLTDQSYSGTQSDIFFELTNLMPETHYWAGLSYSDPGCEPIHTRVVNFTTEAIERRCDCYDYSSDYMVVRSSFRYVPSGSDYGCLIGTDANLTLEHCQESRKVGSHAIEGNEEDFRERFEDLQPNATYYYRAYVTYRGRTYYSRVYEKYHY